MSQAPRRFPIPELLGSIERSVSLLGFGLPFNEVIGQPRDMRVCDLPKPLAATMRGGRIAVMVRH
jgi:hypothetical protein